MNSATLKQALKTDHLAQPVLSIIQLLLIFVGSLFWIMARLTEGAFDVNTYGDFALLFPAEFWAALMMGASALVWVGLRHPVKRWMVAVGSSIHLAQFVALGFSAFYTNGEPIVGVFCSGFFGPLFAYMLMEALRDP